MGAWDTDAGRFTNPFLQRASSGRKRTLLQVPRGELDLLRSNIFPADSITGPVAVKLDQRVLLRFVQHVNRLFHALPTIASVLAWERVVDTGRPAFFLEDGQDEALGLRWHA